MNWNYEEGVEQLFSDSIEHWPKEKITLIGNIRCISWNVIPKILTLRVVNQWMVLNLLRMSQRIKPKINFLSFIACNSAQGWWLDSISSFINQNSNCGASAVCQTLFVWAHREGDGPLLRLLSRARMSPAPSSVLCIQWFLNYFWVKHFSDFLAGI